MKSQLLKFLNENHEFVSGETLSKHLGVSRVAVWKHIQKLQACGYDIHSGPRGYRLVESPDTPYPWEMPERESRIHFFETAVSTMDIARELARKGCPDFTIVIAETQTRGRGRMERDWWSPQGGLYFTLVLRPHLPPAKSPLVNFCAAFVLARTLQDFCGVDARVKWPNDVLIHGRKVSGMLSEMEAAGDQVSFINIGIGINMNNDLPPDLPSATSIKNISGKTSSRKAFLSEFLDRLEKRIHQSELAGVIAEWKTCSATLGQQVRIVTRQGVTEGKAMDVDPNGALVVRTADGTLKEIYYGDCFHT
jgi:BirA family transcriptional regulator, biotin operon repressor / biotin---[acetyl-CoA-carboxylase] ligase